MNALYSLVLVFVLVLVALFGAEGAGLETIFGICIPATAAIIFVVGFAYRIFKWAKSPVPFRIPTTGGQMKSYDPKSFPQNKWDCPANGREVVIRMFLEICCFRSLFRNTTVYLKKDVNGEARVGYFSEKWLWLFAILFHYSFLVIVLRHMRLFTEPVPVWVTGIDFIDGILQIGAPVLYMSDVLIMVGLLFLLGRRLWDAKIRYISLVNDFFPLFLILGIALSGIYMRYFAKVDVVAIKELTMGLVTFNPHIPEGIDVTFYIHLFLVSVLLVYFPFSKLMHLGGVFLSPTRNLPNDTREHHHENPWNSPGFTCHTYEAYEDDFREPMAEAGLPLDKQPEAKPEEAPEEA
mgnify:CR=1 FL=1